jgi:hypothetical protein
MGSIARAEAPGVSAVADGLYNRRRFGKTAAGFAQRAVRHSALRNVNKGISYGLIVVGLGLVLFGLAVVGSAGPEFSGSFANSPLDKTFWPLIGGVLVGALGAGWLLFGSERP